MITDDDIAGLCADIDLAQPPGEWEQLELPAEGIAFGLKDFAVKALNGCRVHIHIDIKDRIRRARCGQFDKEST